MERDSVPLDRRRRPVREEGWMHGVRAATSPESGLFHAVETRSAVKDLTDRFNDLCSRGQGYIEVRPPDRGFPGADPDLPR
jgi:hypothetical protein